ncbi:MAG: carboxymuconolactone decarboxylase family protein [Microthrixaceae bacterium]
MPRLSEVPRSEVHSFGEVMYGLIFGDRDPVEEPGTASGTPGDWWTVTALSPDAFDHICNGLIYYRSPNRKLDPRLRELGQIRAGWGSGSRFVFSQHCKAMRDNGFSDEQVAAIPHWQVADCFNDVERAVLAYSDCLVQDHGRVPDGIFAALKEHLSDEEILELTYITCTYAMHTTISRALQLELDNHPDPVVEAPDPDGNFAGLEVFEEKAD